MLVVDANILLRAALGSKVLRRLRTYAERVEFYAPEVVFQEAGEHLPKILAKQGIPAARKLRCRNRNERPSRVVPGGSCSAGPARFYFGTCTVIFRKRI